MGQERGSSILHEDKYEENGRKVDLNPGPPTGLRDGHLLASLRDGHLNDASLRDRHLLATEGIQEIALEGRFL
jgi:hypothetical protein